MLLLFLHSPLSLLYFTIIADRMWPFDYIQHLQDWYITIISALPPNIHHTNHITASGSRMSGLLASLLSPDHISYLSRRKNEIF